MKNANHTQQAIADFTGCSQSTISRGQRGCRYRQAKYLAEVLIRAMRPLRERVKTITFDNDLEFSRHLKIGKNLGANMYFSRPYASWQRGINENAKWDVSWEQAGLLAP